MAIPDFQSLMLPLLKLLESGQNVKLSDMVKIMSDKFALTEDERNEWLPSGVQKVMYNRVAWAKQYLKNADLFESPEKGVFRITEKGKAVLSQDPLEVNIRFLKELESNSSQNDISLINNEEIVQENKTPEEMIENAQVLYLNSLQKELLEKLKKVDPIDFERIVIKLMEKMNYGIGTMTPTSHDGGIDGIISEDELGLEKIYLQAKRYSDNKINAKEIQNFIGALGCSPVRKAVFITTSFFDQKAKEKAKNLQGKILRLIDGEELTKLMIKHNVGVQKKNTIEIKKVDEDFFTEE